MFSIWVGLERRSATIAGIVGTDGDIHWFSTSARVHSNAAGAWGKWIFYTKILVLFKHLLTLFLKNSNGNARNYLERAICLREQPFLGYFRICPKKASVKVSSACSKAWNMCAQLQFYNVGMDFNAFSIQTIIAFYAPSLNSFT